MEIPYKNLFMACPALNRLAVSSLPQGFSFRLCRKDETAVWMDIQLDGSMETQEGLTAYFNHTYAPKGDLFFERCLFVCEEKGKPVGACFLWPMEGRTTVHWLKIRPAFEGRGLARALLSRLLLELPEGDYPVYLHTQLSSYKAVKLYTDLGFSLLVSPPKIGGRSNGLAETLPYLKQLMPPKAYSALTFAEWDEKRGICRI